MLGHKRHLIVDGQIFQSIARHRGMGRYSEHLLRQLIDEGAYSSIQLVLSTNDMWQDTEQNDVEARFADIKIVQLDLKNSSEQGVAAARSHNVKIVDSYIENTNIEPSLIDYLILAPFQEPIVSVFPNLTQKFLIFYDLIPYLYHEQYRHEMPFDSYLERFNLLFEADKLLAISESARSDAITYLGIPRERVAAIHGAAIRSVNETEPETGGLNISEKYILMPTGGDPRKNNLNAVKGFELFNALQQQKYKLVITSTIPPSERAKLRKVSKNLVFTGSVSDGAMDWLYDNAETVLFVPECEGLGLPLLEALSSGKRVVCSSIDVFKEISETAFHYCDHTNDESISVALREAIELSSSNSKNIAYNKIQNFYTWEQTARRAINAMHNTPIKPSIKKPKICVFSPSPDGISAIGKVVAETHASLSEYFNVDYYLDAGVNAVSMRPNFLKHIAQCYPSSLFSVEAYSEYDAVFYHIGNSEYHLDAISNSLYLPGYAIIHDTNISDAYKVMVEQNRISPRRADLEAEITMAADVKLSNHLASLVSNQLGVITHSEYARKAVVELNEDNYLEVDKVDLPSSISDYQPKRTYEHLTLGIAGIIADIKGTEVIDRLANDQKYDIHNFLVFGINFSSSATIRRLRSYPNVKTSLNISDLDFISRMRELDIFVNYRIKYQGETSLSTLEAMRQGVVVIVRNVGWYSELPDDAVVKVEAIDEVKAKLDELIRDKKKLAAISKSAVEYVAKQHNHGNYVKGMVDMMEKIDRSRGDIKQVARLLKSGKVTSRADLRKARDL